METNDPFSDLKKIKPVDPPPFLFTRIQARLQSLSEQPAPVTWQFSFAAAAALVLFLNVNFAVKAFKPQPDQNLKTVVSAMQLSGNNYLYD